MNSVMPSARDLAEIGLAIQYFPGAWGCVGPDGVHRQSVDPKTLWMMLPETPEAMSELWKHADISTGPTSSYARMLASKDRQVTVVFYKISLGWFSGHAWTGNVSLDFDGLTINVGSIAGRSQMDMWRQLKAFLAAHGNLHNSTDGAIAAISQ